MSRELVNRICATLPGAENSDPWGGGHDCWKVGGKMFAVIGAINPAVSVKTDGIETAEILIDSGIAERAPYMHGSWVALLLTCTEDEIRHRITESYRIIRNALPKKVKSELEPF